MKLCCFPIFIFWNFKRLNSSKEFQVSKNREAHKDCFKKVENLADELKLAKAQLEKLMISCGRSFSRPGTVPHSPEVSDFVNRSYCWNFDCDLRGQKC